MKTLILLATTLVVATATAHATPIVDKECNVSFEPATGWKGQAQHDKDRVVLVDATGAAVFMVICTDRDHGDAVLKELDKGIAGMVSDVKHGPAKDIAVNGLAGVVVDGHGTVNKKPVSLSLLTVKTPDNKHAVITLAIFPTASTNDYGPTILAMVESLKSLAK
jgi:hypothetical protein